MLKKRSKEEVPNDFDPYSPSTCLLLNIGLQCSIQDRGRSSQRLRTFPIPNLNSLSGLNWLQVLTLSLDLLDFELKCSVKPFQVQSTDDTSLPLPTMLLSSAFPTEQGRRLTHFIDASSRYRPSRSTSSGLNSGGYFSGLGQSKQQLRLLPIPGPTC